MFADAHESRGRRRARLLGEEYDPAKHNGKVLPSDWYPSTTATPGVQQQQQQTGESNPQALQASTLTISSTAARGTINPPLVTSATLPYRGVPQTVIPLPDTFSDGLDYTPQTHYVYEPLPYSALSELARHWNNRPGQPSSTAAEAFDRMPLNYHCYVFPRSDRITVDRRIYGHPSRKNYKTIAQFAKHFIHMVVNQTTDGCKCICCK